LLNFKSIKNATPVLLIHVITHTCCFGYIFSNEKVCFIDVSVWGSQRSRHFLQPVFSDSEWKGETTMLSPTFHKSFLVLVAFLLMPLCAIAGPLMFQRLDSSHSTGYTVGTSNDYFHDSFSNGDTLSNGYHVSAGAENFAIAMTVTPYDWVIQMLGSEVLGLHGLLEIGLSYFSYSATLQLAGDPGARALISGSAFVDGYSMFNVFASPSANVRSYVEGTINVSGEGLHIHPNLDRSRNWVDSLTDTSIQDMGRSTGQGISFEMEVGETIIVEGRLDVESYASINDYCASVFGVEICVGGAGPFAIAQTVGQFGANLNIEPINAPIPEPETYAMMLTGLGLLGFVARRRKQHAA
jgi:hypothetical protein